ncbi:hypothetical protein BDN70DRAFT_775892, partial [Pholiota conissans]
ALHNSAQRVNPPRCHSKTRVEVLERLHNWIIMQLDWRKHWLLWLNGAAGAGKSAIMQTTAEDCVRAAIAIASFIFMRTDNSRNHTKYLVGTLVYQLLQQVPETADEILLSIEDNPLVFAQSLETQFMMLVVLPLLHISNPLHQPFVIIIDELDACLDQSHQADLIKVISNISRWKDIPVIFLISSRREPQILAEFGMVMSESTLEVVPLDDSDASEDIRNFLNDKFTIIRQARIHRKHLPNNWPSISIVNEIVDKSSGQFIFASTVVNY